MNINISENQPKLLVLLGPTAVGKSACGIELAARLQGEIISGDSMQFYRHMDIGTAKISEPEKISKENCFVPHHMLDILTPDQEYSVADFQQDASKLILKINGRGKLPILVGGTGLYMTALTDGYTLDAQLKEDPDFREAKKQEYALKGGAALLAELAAVDPVSAQRINCNDVKRLIRALEVHHLTGLPLSLQAKKNPPPWQIRFWGLTMERELLYSRINRRVISMVQAGFIEEVKNLLSMGYSRDLKPMQGLGYKQVCSYLAGEISLDEAIDLIQRGTRHFAKRQLTWWRKDTRVRWFEVTEETDFYRLAAKMLAEDPFF